MKPGQFVFVQWDRKSWFKGLMLSYERNLLAPTAKVLITETNMLDIPRFFWFSVTSNLKVKTLYEPF